LYYAAPENIAFLQGQGASLLDIADKPDNTFQKLCPYYPHGGIECPGWALAATVEGIWQASKSIGTRAPGFANDAFLNMAIPTFREPGEDERLFGWRYGIEGRIIPRERANKVLFIRPYLETVKGNCGTEVNALHELVLGTEDRIYVYDSSFTARNDGHDDAALTFTSWFNNSVRVAC
jgi:hypothetical protein